MISPTPTHPIPPPPTIPCMATAARPPTPPTIARHHTPVAPHLGHPPRLPEIRRLLFPRANGGCAFPDSLPREPTAAHLPALHSPTCLAAHPLP